MPAFCQKLHFSRHALLKLHSGFYSYGEVDDVTLTNVGAFNNGRDGFGLYSVNGDFDLEGVAATGNGGYGFYIDIDDDSGSFDVDGLIACGNSVVSAGAADFSAFGAGTPDSFDDVTVGFLADFDDDFGGFDTAECPELVTPASCQ